MLLQLGETITLDGEAAHYVRDVLRLGVGDRIEVFGTDGRAFRAALTATTPGVELSLDEELDGQANESPCHVTLFQAVPKGDRFDWVLEKATELGVSQIVPIFTARSVVKIPPAKFENRVTRWQKICDGAARQCGRSISAHVAQPMSLADAVESPRRALEFVVHPSAVLSLPDAVRESGEAELGIWVGPEGGFEEAELDLLDRRARRCRMGPRVLRSETAGIVALAVVQAMTGGLA